MIGHYANCHTTRNGMRHKETDITHFGLNNEKNSVNALKKTNYRATATDQE